MSKLCTGVARKERAVNNERNRTERLGWLWIRWSDADKDRAERYWAEKGTNVASGRYSRTHTNRKARHARQEKDQGALWTRQVIATRTQQT